MATDENDLLQALRDKEAFNFALFQHSPLPMTVVDQDGRVVKSNLARRGAAEDLPELGAPLFENAGRDCDRELRSALMEAIRTAEVERLAERRVGGRCLVITIAPFPRGAIVISEDITEQRIAEQEVLRQQEELVQAQKLATLGTMLSGVAHEISNPNSIMLLAVSALERMQAKFLSETERVQAGSGQPDIDARPRAAMRAAMEEQLALAAHAARRVQAIVQDLKDFSRNEGARLAESVDVNEVVRDAVTLLGPLIRDMAADFVADYQPDLPTVAGNPQRLEQVIVNLVSNACQAIPGREGGVHVRTCHDAGQGTVRITVRDQGAGISAEDLERIKDPFFTTRRDRGGTGLGLSVSDRIVRSHQGELVFESVQGRGTTATVVLPCERAIGGIVT